jgi:RimJ/RimL family protein N-acetyltransferase
MSAADEFSLEGKHIRLAPLERHHVDGLVAAAGADPSLYHWSPVPQGRAEATEYIDTALAWKQAGTAVPFAIVRRSDGVVIGSTRFWNLERRVIRPMAARRRMLARSDTPG